MKNGTLEISTPREKFEELTAFEAQVLSYTIPLSVNDFFFMPSVNYIDICQFVRVPRNPNELFIFKDKQQLIQSYSPCLLRQLLALHNCLRVFEYLLFLNVKRGEKKNVQKEEARENPDLFANRTIIHEPVIADRVFLFSSSPVIWDDQPRASYVDFVLSIKCIPD